VGSAFTAWNPALGLLWESLLIRPSVVMQSLGGEW
jgi:hypothetical protein